MDAALDDCEKGRPLAIFPMVASGFLQTTPRWHFCAPS